MVPIAVGAPTFGVTTIREEHMATVSTSDRRRGSFLVGSYLALAVTGPLNPLLADPFVFFLYIAGMIVLGLTTIVYGVTRGWPPEIDGVLPGTGEADRKRQGR
jgi:hypothetical protein